MMAYKFGESWVCGDCRTRYRNRKAAVMCCISDQVHQVKWDNRAATIRRLDAENRELREIVEKLLQQLNNAEQFISKFRVPQDWLAAALQIKSAEVLLTQIAKAREAAEAARKS